MRTFSAVVYGAKGVGVADCVIEGVKDGKDVTDFEGNADTETVGDIEAEAVGLEDAVTVEVGVGVV